MLLEKILQSQGFGSRKYCQQLIKNGSVLIENQVYDNPKQNLNTDNLNFTVFGEPYQYRENVYIALNKPQDYECSHQATHHQSVFSLLPEILIHRGVQCVGRLDQDTTGLLLLTDDGMLAHELLSPRKHVDKVYFAKVSGQFGENEIARFKEGLDIGNGERSKQARLQILKADVQESEVLITIMEGKFHQVKRMVKAVGSEVLYLKRLSMGSLKLDEELKLGEYRRLTKAELQELKEHRR